MSALTDRIRQRLDVVESRTMAAADVKSGIPVSPSQWGPLVQDYLGGAIGAYCAAHNPTVALAQVADYRQQVEDAEAVLGFHRQDPFVEPETFLCYVCRRRGTSAGPCPDARRAQDRLNRLDALTALVVGETS